jgi:rSAM/selenodomain-associated transferase 2
MTVSIIIPALNEARCIAATVQALRSQGPCEIIIVDGGSHDGTATLASAADLVLQAPAGRAAQMNAGAAHAAGDCLLFLHADCLLETGALAALEKSLAQKGVLAGCFTMRVQAEGWLYRSIDWCATARVRMTGLVYGDQGLFLRRQNFAKVGGFPSVSFMEDVLLSKTLRRRHPRIAVLPQKIYVSPRRWQKSGILHQTLRNWMLTALAAAGVSPDQLARHYPRVR